MTSNGTDSLGSDERDDEVNNLSIVKKGFKR